MRRPRPPSWATPRADAGDAEDEWSLDSDDSDGEDGWSPDSMDSGPMVMEAEVPPLEPTDVAERRVRTRRKSAAAAAADREKLKASPENLPGVGKVTAEHLARLGIERIEDLLWHLPTRYEDYSKLRSIAELQPGEQATVIANLWEVTERKVSMKRQMVQGVLGDGTGTLARHVVEQMDCQAVDRGQHHALQRQGRPVHGAQDA